MTTTDSPIALMDNKEPIPGYTLEERIGIGGYGEVWRANAPGGLKKAIKIVHGDMNDSRTEREFKAMERIRAVSHPMLLSLERVEVIQNHLFIVTELADGSLKDRFDACLKNGSGIPREELVGYLRDAADALDFLYEKHHLQHLDIKPENLLMVGGRVKVADFGLVKDLADKGMSLVGGLTPMYAPPEVFDGAPSRHSDQYSLAIVYQEMLTGEAPFGGRTAAQLASQHVNCEPMVSPLPVHDRAPIERALSKDPQRRFPSCRTLIQELIKAPEIEAAQRIRRSRPKASHETTERATSRGPRRQTAPPSTGPKVDEPASAEENGTVRLSQCKQLGATMLPDSTDVAMESPVEFTVGSGVRPTLYVGVGGAAIRTLKKLKRRVADLAAPIEQLPSFAMLHLDVASDGDNHFRLNDDEIAFRIEEQISMPLRDAREYRDRSELLLEWLNRRWLYNIPRSLRTEGMRPLGRLAFMDHFEEINDALRREISEIMTPDAVKDTGKRLARDICTDAPQVVLVGSISGGAGSGCILDLGYTVRDVLNEMGLPDSHVQGVLLHSTPRKAAGREIAMANSVACLSELSYFASTEGGYPGEPACGIQPRTVRRAPFANTYFAPLGEDLDDAAFGAACRKVAEYLFQSTMAPSADFFVNCREQEGPYPDQPTAALQVRSFGVSKVGGGDCQRVQSIAELVSRALVDSWIGGQKTATSGAGLESEIENEVDQLFARLGVSTSGVISAATSTINSTVSNNVETYFRRVIRENSERLDDSAELTPVERAEQLLSVVDELAIGSKKQEDASACLRSVVENKFRKRIDQPQRAISFWLTELIDRPQYRVVAAETACRLIGAKLADLKNEVSQATRKLKCDINELHMSIVRTAQGPQLDERGKPIEPPVITNPESALVAYATLRMLQVAHMVSLQFATELARANLGDAADIAKLSNGLRIISAGFEKGAEVFEAGDEFSFDSERSSTVLRIQRQRLAIASRLDDDLQQQYFDRQTSLSSLISASKIEWSHLESAMRLAATRLVASEISHVWTDQLFSGNSQSVSEVDEHSTLRSEITKAAPPILACGGVKRLLVLAPYDDAEVEAWSQKTAQAAGQPVAFVPAEDSSVTFCYETEHTSLRNVIAGLIGDNSNSVKLAERLHSRIDIDWPPIA